MMTFDAWLISRLRAHGAYSGVSDGAYGRAVIEALKRVQQAEGLPVTGVADEETVAVLRGPGNSRDLLGNDPTAPAIPAEPSWMREARRLMGTREIPGSKSNPVILSWAKALSGWVASFYKDDDTAWCGLFMAHCFGLTLPIEPLPSNPLSALAWSQFGQGLREPALGALLVFSREGGGHVGLYVGEDADSYHVLGGNQSNSVSITRVAKSRCVGIRWPKSGERLVGGRIRLQPNGEVSRNEA